LRQELEEARRAEQEEKDNIKQQKKADKEAKALKTKQKTDKEDMALAKKKKKGQQARLIFHPLFSPLSFPISQFPSSLLGSGI
jgi:hypothetical protein